ncbi:MFS transporter [Allohahella marinimesophila]|uniref:MFS transporter n=2 Tax=Allohahella marinimesophila TaxID=1054972 RepID=A0ABP7Q1W6_9GAMM
MVQSMLLVTIPLYALELGASPVMIGSILSVPYILPLIFAIPLGAAVTRIGGVKVIVAGGFGMTMGPLAMWLVPGYTGLIICQLLVGVAHILMVLAAQSIIAGLGRGKALEQYFGWYATCLSGGQLVGPLWAGYMIDTDGTRSTFAVMAGIALISVASGFFLTGAARLGQATRKSMTGFRAQGRLLKQNSGVQISIATTVAVMFAMGAYGSFLPVYLESLSISATMIGSLVSLRAFASMAIRPFMAPTISLLGGRAAAMVISVGLVGLALCLTGFFENIVPLGVLALALGVGSGISQPLSMVVLAEHVDAEQRAGALGMRLMGNRGVQFSAPLLLGVLAEFTSFTVTFLVAGVVVFIGLAIIYRLVPGFKQRERDLAVL